MANAPGSLWFVIRRFRFAIAIGTAAGMIWGRLSHYLPPDIWTVCTAAAIGGFLAWSIAIQRDTRRMERENLEMLKELEKQVPEIELMALNVRAEVRQTAAEFGRRYPTVN